MGVEEQADRRKAEGSSKKVEVWLIMVVLFYCLVGLIRVDPWGPRTGIHPVKSALAHS